MSSEPPASSGWTVRDRVHLVLLTLIGIGAVVHHAALWYWFIEDAAISFAYAENLGTGEGLVPFPGGERVEGYSNPAWVFFLAPFYALGLKPWMYEGVRWIQVLMCIGTVPLVYLTAREALGRNSDAPIVAAGLLAASSQFAVWSSAGLESGLMNLLFAAAMWRSMVELRTARWPVSALLWVGVTLCRPEAILYAAVAGFCMMLFHLHARRGLLPTLKWLATFFVPYGAYQAWRYTYFAWEWPNTYYAKLERRTENNFLEWGKRPWNYTRNFLLELGWGFFLPAWALGILGHGRWRLPVAALVTLLIGVSTQLATDQRFLLAVVVGFMLLAFWIGLRASEDDPPRWLAGTGLGVAVALVALSELLRRQFGMVPNEVPTPDWIASAPPYLLLVVALALPLLSVGARGWQLRVMAWGHCVAAVLFALIAQWDWMEGYRWFAPAVVPGSLLLGLGLESLAHVVQESLSRVSGRLTAPGYAALTLTTLAAVPANVVHTVKIVEKNQTTPKHVKVRVDFVDGVRDRLHIDERLVDLEVDQGAHLYWSDFEMVDIAGLVDVPLAHHKFERAFVREYIFQEKKPHYAHVHGGWSANSRIPSHPEWRSDYLEIPGYPANKSQLHIGNYVRRDLIVSEKWPWEGPRIALEGGVVVHGVHVPSEPGSGRKMYVEVGVSLAKPGQHTVQDDFRLVLFASDDSGRLHSWEVPPGYDWLPPHEWKPTEVFVGKLDLPVPESLPPGRYDLGLVAWDVDGRVLAPLLDDPEDLPLGVVVGGLGDVAPRLAAGEVRFVDALEVLTVEGRGEAAIADREAALAAAAEGRCDEAVERWWLARKHRAAEEDWEETHRPTVHRALSRCFAMASDTAVDRAEKVALLVRARGYDWWTPEYRERAAALADELYAEGLEARAAKDWEAAYRLFADCVDVDRSRSWARRYAEEARAYRLGIDEETKAQQEADRERRKQEAEARRKEAEARKKEREE